MPLDGAGAHNFSNGPNLQQPQQFLLQQQHQQQQQQQQPIGNIKSHEFVPMDDMKINMHWDYGRTMGENIPDKSQVSFYSREPLDIVNFVYSDGD